MIALLRWIYGIDAYCSAQIGRYFRQRTMRKELAAEYLTLRGLRQRITRGA